MKIIKSVTLILAALAIISYGTYSYFSDTETSTGNTFTAGKLDLRFQVEGAPAQWTDVNGAQLFSATDLFNGDLKPGDEGEKTVRLWVDDNPSCGKVSVTVVEDKDNTCTEPEIGDEVACATSPTGIEAGSGELNDAVNFAVWEDPNCNNVLDGAETILTSGTITEDKAYGIGELPTSQATAKCYGIAYCFGTWNGTTCEGSLVNNATQTDSFTADIIINASQKRNQYPNGCPTGEIGGNTACVPAPSGMISWWPGDGNANDIIGNNNGAMMNDATFASGKVGQAFSLDGVDDYATFPDSSVWAFNTNDFSIDLWTNFNSVRSGPHGQLPNVFVGQDAGGGSNNKWVFYLADDGLNFHINGPASVFIGPIPFSPITGQWYHLSLTRSENTYSFYVNGALLGTASDATLIPDVNASLTTGQVEGLGYFNGLIDEVEIFDRALSQAEIEAIYNADSSGKCKIDK